MSRADRNWQGNPEGCCWAWCYDDGIAVYHSLTGSTHVLPTTAWQVLCATVQGCSNIATLQAHLLVRGISLDDDEVATALDALQMARLASPVF